MTIHRAAVLLATITFAAPALATPLLRSVQADSGITLVPSSPAFDQSCTDYISRGNAADVPAASAKPYCACMADELHKRGMKRDALAFFARTYTDDVTAFIDEYTNGDEWMAVSVKAEAACTHAGKAEASASAPAAETTGFPRNAGSWGGVVRSGPGKQYKRLGSLSEGARVTLLENTGVMENNFPWIKISYDEGQTGYQWGGILCAIDTPMPEVFEMCTR